MTSIEYTSRFCIWLMFPLVVLCQSYSDADRLVTDKLAGYNMKLRPLNDQSQAVTVNFSLSMFQLTDVDVVKGRITIAAMTVMSWYDEKITWNPAAYGNMNSVQIPVQSVWNPGIICASPSTEVQVLGASWMNVRYFPNGYTVYPPGSIIESSCAFDVSYWPFDRQTCLVTFMAYGYLSTEVDIHIFNKEITDDNYIEHGEWEFTGSSSTDESFGGMDFIKYQIYLERRYAFYIMNIILPIVGIMILNPIVFLLPSESGERVGYSITVLLSIAVFFTIISDNLPTSSAPMPKIIIYILVGLGSSMFISLAVILNLRTYHRKDAVMPGWATGIVRLTHGHSFENKITNVDVEGQKEHRIIKVIPANTEEFNGDTANNIPEKKLEFTANTRAMASEVGWKEVSRAIDKVLFVTFCLFTIIVTIIFMAILISGKQDH